MIALPQASPAAARGSVHPLLGAGGSRAPPSSGISTCTSRRRISRPRAAPKLLTEEIDKATDGELKVRLHLSGTLADQRQQHHPGGGENVVQLGDDLFNSGNIPVAGIPRLPMLIQSYEDFAKADAVLKPYIERRSARRARPCSPPTAIRCR